MADVTDETGPARPEERADGEPPAEARVSVSTPPPPSASPEERAAEAEAKLAATHERLLRTAADLDNLRKRTRRDVEEAAVRGRMEVLREILPALDSLDLALKSAEKSGPTPSLVEGVEMVRRQFLASMGRFDLKPLEARGRIFDPALHEAVAQVSSADHGNGEILEVMRTGYLIGDRLLRPAMVVVAQRPATAGEADQVVFVEEEGGAGDAEVAAPAEGAEAAEDRGEEG